MTPDLQDQQGPNNAKHASTINTTPPSIVQSRHAQTISADGASMLGATTSSFSSSQVYQGRLSEGFRLLRTGLTSQFAVRYV